MNTKVKFCLKIFVSISLLLLIYININMDDLYRYLLNTSMSLFFLSILLFYFSWFIAAVKWKTLLINYDIITLLEVQFISQFYGFMLPSQLGSELVKAYRLGKGMPDAERVAASVLVDKIISLLALLLITLLGLILSENILPNKQNILNSILALTLIFFLILYAVSFEKIYKNLVFFIDSNKLKNKVFFNKLKLFLHFWQLYINDKTIMLKVFLLGIFYQSVLIGVVCILAYAIRIEVFISDWCWIVGLVSVAGLLPVTVGGLGVREVSLVLTLSWIGISPEKATALSLLALAICLLGVLTGGILELLGNIKNDFLTKRAIVLSNSINKIQE